jgi:xanthine/uracil permease
MALATFVGIFLNLVLPRESKGLAVEAPDFTGGLQEEASK